VPLTIRYGGLVLAAAFFVFLVWFFAFRDTSGTQGGQTAGPPPPRPALGKTLPLDQYRAGIRDALDDVEAARSLSGSEREAKLNSAAGALERFEGASISGSAGSLAEVDNTAIIAELRSSGPNIEAVRSSLSLLLDSLGSTGVVAESGEQALSGLRDVLSDPDFNYERDLSPLEKMARWLAGFMGDGEADPNLLFQRLAISLIVGIVAGGLTYLASERLGNRWLRLGLAVTTGVLAAVVTYAGVAKLIPTFEVLAALGLLVVVVAGALIIGGAYLSATPSTKPRAISELAATLGMSAGEARRRATEAAGAGDYRLAIRYRSLAVLLALDEGGMLSFDRTATDREYLFRAPGGLQGELQPMLDGFEAVWYGESPANAQDWSAYDARATALEANAIEAKAA
jgi:hypothetical protein